MDQLVRAITTDGMVQAVAITSRDLTERARQIHTTLPVGTPALGRALAAASMMGNALKDREPTLPLQQELCVLVPLGGGTAEPDHWLGLVVSHSLPCQVQLAQHILGILVACLC